MQAAGQESVTNQSYVGNFLQYSEQDFSSYMEYLLNNRNDFYDTNYLARLEH